MGPPQRSSWPSDAEAQAAGRDPEDLGVPVSACQAVLEALPRSGGARSAGPRLPLSVNLVKCKSHTAVFFTGGGEASFLLMCPYSGPELLFPPGLEDLMGTGSFPSGSGVEVGRGAGFEPCVSLP